MGLTAEVELALKDAELDVFFENNRAAFKEIARLSHEYSFNSFAPASLTLRKDDVAKILVAALVVNSTLRDKLAEKKLRQQMWFSRFADLILDRLWEELLHEHSENISGQNSEAN